MTEQYSPKTVTYPAWFIRQLAKAIESAAAMDKALGDCIEGTASFYVEAIPLMFEGDKVGTLLWLDDQWQFEPDVDYWGLKKDS